MNPPPPGMSDEERADVPPTGSTRRMSFSVEGAGPVSALLLTPASPRALYVLAHGAGAGMEHPFMEVVARALASRRFATFRYNFPYMELGRGRPDWPPLLLRTVRAAVNTAAVELPGLPLLAGGKSMGGRMSSEAQAQEPLAGVRGLVFLGFPLHAPKREGRERAAHLSRVDLPMLFLQGTRDALADLDLMRAVADELGERAELNVVDGADHGFHVPKRSGRTDEEVIDGLADTIEQWVGETLGL